jgi:hypothetical protein
MERLAWIETLDRHGDVATRHPVYEWPVKVGRAYTNDIVLDDPYIAASHLEISQTDKGRYQLKRLDSINGLTVNTLRGKQIDAIISANNVARIGQTQLRIRPIDYLVPAEKLLPGIPWLRGWPAFFIGVTVLLSSHLLHQWLNYDRAEVYEILLSPILPDIPLLLLWAGFWALIGRVQSGCANIIAHAVIASLLIGLLMLISCAIDYVDFAFNQNQIINMLLYMTFPLILGTLFYRHIILVSRISRRRLRITLTALFIGLGSVAFTIEVLTPESDRSYMSFSRTIGPPSMLRAQGKSTDEFISGASVLKSRVSE